MKKNIPIEDSFPAYFVIEGLSKTKKIRSLEENLMLCSSFYPLLFVLEHEIRDRVNAMLCSNVGENWIETLGRLFHQKEPTPFINYEIEIVRGRIGRFLVKQEDLVRDANFGFWVEFFYRYNYKMLKGIPIQIFHNLPGSVKRKDIYSSLYEIKEFRNRLYHHNVNFLINNNISPFSHESSKFWFQKITDVFKWLDENLYTTLMEMGIIKKTLKIIEKEK